MQPQPTPLKFNQSDMRDEIKLTTLILGPIYENCKTWGSFHKLIVNVMNWNDVK